MIVQLAGPGVQYHENPRRPARETRITRQFHDALSHGLHEEVVPHFLVNQKRGAHGLGDCGDEVKVIAGHELGLAFLQPCASVAAMTRRTRPVAAGVIDPEGLITLGATIPVAAHGRGAAVADVGERLVLGRQRWRFLWT